MKHLLHVFILIFTLPLTAQDTSRFICFYPEYPHFPGGDEAYRKYMKDSVHYPSEERAKGIQGTVYVSFEITSTGKIENAKIYKGVENGPGLNAEALRVISHMPDWTPVGAVEEGKNILLIQPVRFLLDTTKNKTDAKEDSSAPVPIIGDTLKNDTIPAEFPGGTAAQGKFINTYTKCPVVAKEKGQQGEVIVLYDVDVNGNVINARVFKGVDGASELNDEALRVVRTFPKHTPATCNGKPVQFTMGAVVRYTLQ